MNQYQLILNALILTAIVSVTGGLSNIKNNGATATDTLSVTMSKDSRKPVRNSSINLNERLRNIILESSSQLTGLATSELRIAKVERLIANTCLNLPRPGENCNDNNSAIALKVTVEGKKQRLVFHAYQDGSEMRFNEAASQMSLPNQVADAVLNYATQLSDVSRTALNVISYKRREWSYGCEQPTFPHPCDPVVTSGWEVVVGVGDKRWVYLSDNTGSLIKFSPESERSDLPKFLANIVLKDASEWSGLATKTLQIVDTKRQRWGNSCQFMFGLACATIFQPISGWEVTVNSGTQLWTYNVDDKGKSVILDRSPSLEPKAVEVIKKDAAKFTSAPQLRIISIDLFDDWNGICSNIPRCTRPISPGAKATVSDGQNIFVYRVKEDGSQFEFQAIESLPKSLVNAVLIDAAQRAKTKVAVSINNIVKAERMVWNNGCMGLGGGVCTQAEVPGWRLTVGIANQVFVYHTDNNSIVKFNEAASRMRR